MKSLYVLLTLFLALPLLAQSGFAPEVQADGRVTFRLKATNATDIRVDCDSLPSAKMQRDDEGVWSYVTPPLAPDFYGYSFVIDGVRALDLRNPLMKYNLLGSESEVHVPGPSSLPWEVNDVPHGVIHRHFYHSAACGDDRAWFVYTPPGYKPSRWKRYPTLYLLHGFSDDASAWWSVGQANIIFDNLIARGQARPMVVVMPLGYGTLEVLHRRNVREADPELHRRNTDAFHASLLDEVLPEVERDYRVSKRRQDRAMAGLSMGGYESLTVGLNDLQQFAWIGAFSAGKVSTNYAAEFPGLDASANGRLRLLWISCGKDDALDKPNKQLAQWLISQGIHLTWQETPGVHSWRVWRRNLAEFAPLLFK